MELLIGGAGLITGTLLLIKTENLLSQNEIAINIAFGAGGLSSVLLSIAELRYSNRKNSVANQLEAKLIWEDANNPVRREDIVIPNLQEER